MNLFTKEIDKKLFAQYLKGSDLENQVVVAKIFNPYGRGNWYIINSDPSDPNYLWAIVDLVEVEVGSVSRNELENIKLPPFRLGLERDMYFEPINAAELYRGLRAGKTYAEGGEISIEAQNKDMLLNYAEELEHHVKEFEEAAKGAEKVMPWVIAKIERASTDLSDVTHYLASENEKRREYGDGEGEEEYADGGFIKWQDAKIGDSARVKSENKMGVILKDYGRKFHLKFVNGTEKTYDASELEFIKDEYADGGVLEGLSANIYRSEYDSPTNKLYGKKGVIIVDKEVPKIFDADESTPAVKLVRRKLPWGDYIHAIPYDQPEGRGMFGGTFIYSSDSRFPSKYPIPLHDRVEMEKGGYMAKGGLVYKKIYNRGGGGYTTIINGMEYSINKQYGKGTWVAQSDDGEYYKEAQTLSDLKYYLENLKKDSKDSYAEGGEIKDANKLEIGDKIKISEGYQGTFIYEVLSGARKGVRPSEILYQVKIIDSTKPSEYFHIGKVFYKMFTKRMGRFSKVNVLEKGGYMAKGGEIDNYKNLSSQIEKLDKKLKSLENINSKEAYDESQKLIETRSFLLAKMLHEEDKLTGEREGERRAGMDEEFAKGGELTVKIGDRVRQRKKVGSSVVYGIDGIVYETDGITFKLKDKYGNKSDRLYLTSSFKKSEIKSMADGGGTQSLDDIYKDLDNKRTKIRLKIATIVGLDDALEYLNRDFVVSPFRLIEKAVNSGFLTIDEIDKNLWDAATEEAYDIDSDYRDSGQGIGSSDMNAFVSRMLKSAGINIEVVNNRYQRMADGGMMAKGGFVSKGELVWRKLTNAKKMEFLKENFTPEITPRSQETLVGKDYTFLPKNVKIKFEAKYANVEDYAMGGKVKFADKVKAVQESLLKRKKVSPKIQKDYGKTYSPKEAEESAKRIVGAMTAKERLMSKRKKK